MTNWNALTKVGLTDSYYVWDPNMELLHKEDAM
jgi:hypothetical protein